MARGHPDYNAADISFFSIDDPNKNAIAISSGFNRLDNRGRIIWFDDFRQGLHRWTLQNNGTGQDPTHLTDEELSIGYHGSVALYALANNGISVMDSTLVLPVSKKLGVEVGLRLVSNFGDVEIRLSHNYSGTTAKEAIFYIAANSGAIKVYNNLTLTTVYTPSTIAQLLQSWISIKFVIDVENNTWLRCMLGNQQFDLSSYALRTGSTSLQGFTEILLRNTGIDATYKEQWYCGYVIISGDEP